MDNLTRAEKAIKIAIYEGIEPVYAINKQGVTDLYSSFNGLMPIVAEINRTQRTPILIYIQSVELYFPDGSHKNYLYDNADDLIDALQDAILFYYENKEK